MRKFKCPRKQSQYDNTLKLLDGSKGEKLKQWKTFRGSSIDTWIWRGIHWNRIKEMMPHWKVHHNDCLYPAWAAGRDWAKANCNEWRVENRTRQHSELADGSLGESGHSGKANQCWCCHSGNASRASGGDCEITKDGTEGNSQDCHCWLSHSFSTHWPSWRFRENRLERLWLIEQSTWGKQTLF